MVTGVVALLAVTAGVWWMMSTGPGAKAPAPHPTHDASARAHIAGEVVDATGSPIAGAVVDAKEGASTPTGADGQFRLDDLKPGTYHLDAHAKGFVAGGPEAMRRVEVVLSADEGKPEVDGLQLVLRRAAAVHGRVVASGEPVQDATIGIYYLSAEGLTGGLDPYVVDEAAHTDKDGHFALDGIAPGRLQLLVEAPNYALAQSKKLLLEPGETDSDLVVDLAPSATVAGEVTNTDGEPVRADVVLAGGALASSRKVHAGANGHYVFHHLPAGTYTLTARAPGYRIEHVDSVEATVGKATDQDVVMQAASGIFGQVVASDGAGVEGAFVLLRPPKGRWKVLRTDADGRFQWDEPAATAYSATAVSAHFASSQTRQVEVGEPATLRLGGSGAVSGRVVGPDGQPVQAFSVGVGSFEVDGPRPYGPRSVGVEQVNDSAGRFRFQALRPGKYWFRVQTTRYASATSAPVVVTAGREFSGLTIRVGQAGTIAGTVTDSATGKSIGGASVVLFDPGSPFSANKTRTDARGRFQLDGVPPGRRSLRVSKKGYLATVSAGVHVAAGEQAARNVVMRRQKPGERMQFQGIGAMLGKTDDGVLVRGVFPGHPAAQYGLKRGDYIRAVDGRSVEDMPLSGVIEKIRGQAGVPVELEVERKGKGRFTLKIERGQVVVRR